MNEISTAHKEYLAKRQRQKQLIRFSRISIILLFLIL